MFLVMYKTTASDEKFITFRRKTSNIHDQRHCCTTKMNCKSVSTFFDQLEFAKCSIKKLNQTFQGANNLY